MRKGSEMDNRRYNRKESGLETGQVWSIDGEQETHAWPQDSHALFPAPAVTVHRQDPGRQFLLRP